MPDIDGSFITRAAAAASLLIVLASPVSAQQPAEQAQTPGFFTRYDFHLNAEALSSDDPRFKWDTHFGGDLDLVDYGLGRAGVLVDYEAVLGNEYRPFDPNQGNYTLETFGSVRGKHLEFIGAFHHVSRHISDRPKRFAVAWNTVDARVLSHWPLGAATLDVNLNIATVVQNSYVDYKWIGGAAIAIRRPVSPKASVFVTGTGQAIGVDGSVPQRSTQTGGRIEGGVHLGGKAGAIELFAGYEKRVDADPLDFLPQRWAVAGFRLLNR